MKILALDSSATCASVCITDGNALIAQNFQNCGHTHSKTLLPMIEDMLKSSGQCLENIDIIAANHGPGSFTGIRIGIATAQGLAFGCDKKCIGVSTLASMAYNVYFSKRIIICVMDARVSQVYNANFQYVNGKLTRLCEDRAISLNELSKELKTSENKYILIGDGSDLCYNYLNDLNIDVILPPNLLKYQLAYGTAINALNNISDGATLVPSNELVPVYLRLPQAERQRLKRITN